VGSRQKLLSKKTLVIVLNNGWVFLDNIIAACRECGYGKKTHGLNLKGTLIERCPECGQMQILDPVCYIDGMQDEETVFSPNHPRYEEVRKQC